MKKNNLRLLEDLSIKERTSGINKSLSIVVSKREQLGLSPVLLHILNEVRRELGTRENEEESLSLDTNYLLNLIQKSAATLGFDLSSFERDEILERLEIEQKPFGVLQPLIDDPAVSDILVTDYSKISIQQARSNFTVGSTFSDQNAYEHFVERLLQRAGTSYSTKKPIADGMIGSFARIHAVHKCICESGPYLTIRVNRFSSVTINELEKSGLAPKSVFDYLSALIASGNTVLVVGEVGTGKTTLVRALAASFPSDESVLVIEDTPEIRLEHPQTRYISTREANTDGAGRVSPSECIRGGMRMAMNRIVFGEMRDAEAAEAFIDVCASGHPGLSTLHAKSSLEAITRLELFLGRAQKGVSRPVVMDQIATAVQVIVFVNICKQTGQRRIMQVREIGPVADGVLRQREIFSYNLQSNAPSWKIVNRVSAHREALDSLGVNLSSLPATLFLAKELN